MEQRVSAAARRRQIALSKGTSSGTQMKEVIQYSYSLCTSIRKQPEDSCAAFTSVNAVRDCTGKGKEHEAGSQSTLILLTSSYACISRVPSTERKQACRHLDSFLNLSGVLTHAQEGGGPRSSCKAFCTERWSCYGLSYSPGGHLSPTFAPSRLSRPLIRDPFG